MSISLEGHPGVDGREDMDISREKDAFFHFVTANKTDQRSIHFEGSSDSGGTIVLHLTTKVGRLRLEVEREAEEPTEGANGKATAGKRVLALLSKKLKKNNDPDDVAAGRQSRRSEQEAHHKKRKKAALKTFKQLKEEVASAITKGL